MTGKELLERCNKAISTQGYPAFITLILPGRYKTTNKHPLCPGGPLGTIVGDNFHGPGVVVMFNARDVKQYLLKNLETIQLEF